MTLIAPGPVGLVERGTRPVISPFRRTPAGLWLSCFLMVLSAVAWRNGDYFSGGFDVVVVAKAMLAGIALILALVTRRRPEAWAGYRGAPILWLLAYLACSTVGSLLNGAVLASGILTIRLLIMAATVVLLLASFEWETVMSALASAMLTLSIIGAATSTPIVC